MLDEDDNVDDEDDKLKVRERGNGKICKNDIHTKCTRTSILELRVKRQAWLSTRSIHKSSYCLQMYSGIYKRAVKSSSDCTWNRNRRKKIHI